MKEALEDDSGAFFMEIFKKTGLLKEPNRYSIIERRNIYLVKISLALEMRKTYICIDLKSFYASVECVARGLDLPTWLSQIPEGDMAHSAWR